MAETRFLVGDIGGTNIRLATFRSDPRQREGEVIYRTNPQTNKPYQVLEALRDYRGKFQGDFSAVCLGVAGPIKGDEVQLTNRPDLLQRKDIAEALGLEGARVLFVNDMPPHLASVDRLLPAELISIHSGEGDPHGTRAVLMPGTGVGTGGAVYVPSLSRYQSFASEGGHLDFAPRDEQQDRLLRFLRPVSKEMGIEWVSNEFVFAGEGIRRIYAFLKNPDQFSLDGVPKSEEITATVNSNLPPDDLRRRTVELFLQLLGAAAGNLALVFAATGGVYLGGNICLSLRTVLATPPFLDAFLNSGPPTHRQWIHDIPVRLIDYKDSGLLGTGVLALGLV